MYRVNNLIKKNPQVNEQPFTMGFLLIKILSTFLSTNNFSFFASLVTSKARKIIDTYIGNNFRWMFIQQEIIKNKLLG
tara:strand:- start:726 stop:959 length:234 start_codon:yes stop_codon:yes gene_type:complete